MLILIILVGFGLLYKNSKNDLEIILVMLLILFYSCYDYFFCWLRELMLFGKSF